MLYCIIFSNIIVIIVSKITIISNIIVIISNEWVSCHYKSRYLGVFGPQRWAKAKFLPKCQVHLDGQGQRSRKARAEWRLEKWTAAGRKQLDKSRCSVITCWAETHSEGWWKGKSRGVDGGTLRTESSHFRWCQMPVPLKTSRHCVPWKERRSEMNNSVELFWK